MQRRERENLRIVLNKTSWKIRGADGAAELLGLKPTTLISRIKNGIATGSCRPAGVTLLCPKFQSPESKVHGDFGCSLGIFIPKSAERLCHVNNLTNCEVESLWEDGEFREWHGSERRPT